MPTHTPSSASEAVPETVSGAAPKVDSQADSQAAERARAVIRAEAEGLQALADELVGEKAEAFARAVELITECDRHLVVAGVGKSGHIGQKLAASFASTGTPSFFMHPTEASHGDLGMLVPGSVVLAISNSGESRELADVLGFCRRARIPVVGITRAPLSSLGRASTVVLELPRRAEACVNRLAPTTSTAMTLALGDALVVAAMERRGFTSTDFGRRHPGGKLGRRLQTVAEWLAANPDEVPVVAPDASAQEVVFAITQGRNGCVAVASGDDNDGDGDGSSGVFEGIITDGDLRRAMTPDFFGLRARDIMTADALTLVPRMTMGEAVDQLAARRVQVAFVLEGEVPVGLVNTKALAAQGYM